MKHLRNILWPLCVLAMLMGGISACDNSDEAKLEAKWQMCQVVTDGGATQQVDSVFYSFMDGTFMAVCMRADGSYWAYNGAYTMNGENLTVTFVENQGMDFNSPARYMYWPDRSKEFQILTLTRSTLKMVSGEQTFIFRKY